MHTSANSTLLTRSEIWSAELKEILRDEMQMQQYVRMLEGFPDGDQFTIPSIGQAQVDDYVEDTPVDYRPLDLGEFTFTIDQYLSSGQYMTRKAEQDLFYSSQLMSRFGPEQERAVLAHFETTTLAAPEVGVSANSAESIDGTAHRIAGSGTSGAISVADFAYARYALKEANVPDTNLIAIVDPSVEYTLNTLSNLTDLSNNRLWEGIVSDGIATGMRFVKSVYGFDVYTSNFLPTVTDSALNQKDGTTAVDFSSTNGKQNYFFSTFEQPFVGAWRQQPEVDYEYNKDLQRHEFVTTARYGVKLFRPENIVRVATKVVI